MRKQKQFCKKYVHEGLFPEIYLIGHLQNCCDLEKNSHLFTEKALVLTNCDISEPIEWFISEILSA